MHAPLSAVNVCSPVPDVVAKFPNPHSTSNEEPIMTAAFIPSNHCRSIHHSLRWSAYASCVLLLSACATPPSDDAMPSRKPIAYYTSTQAFSAPVAAWPNQAWWKNYGDPQLDALIDAALADAPTIAVASAR